ncbi:hypothetical protein OIDMADRAFT_164233 [Oidiodendron maius Zn]|uniref:Transcription elongation factor Eaf N-terminal domain-containing protein n=1 Tax=Oidiodendron maius (strain Zn) TaxID=913774 RepID=A0A0C3H051_OIDMZ|nr:hypothetical protein OIDMADRAFT_164233 [Oidiodendron maius Zn]
MSGGSIDINAPGKYPIVLSDALLGKTSKESYTSIRYNHRPEPTTTQSLSSLQLQTSRSAASDYDLSFSDDSGKYKYSGVQTSGDGQYVLIFNPEKKHFVLHRIDSTFDMNLVSAPWEKSASTLRSQYAQLESTAKPTETPQRKPSKSSKNTAVAKPEPKRRKSAQTKKKPAVREPTPEEEDDSDDGLTIEYPDARSSRQYKTQTEVVLQQNVSGEEAEEEYEDEDADAEGEFEEQRNQDVDYLTLPSPANNNTGGMSDEDIELDLEAELEQALKETTEGAGEDESDESEEE